MKEEGAPQATHRHSQSRSDRPSDAHGASFKAAVAPFCTPEPTHSALLSPVHNWRWHTKLACGAGGGEVEAEWEVWGEGGVRGRLRLCSRTSSSLRPARPAPLSHLPLHLRSSISSALAVWQLALQLRLPSLLFARPQRSLLAARSPRMRGRGARAASRPQSPLLPRSHPPPRPPSPPPAPAPLTRQETRAEGSAH
eukprot:2085404-Rhodomonas_salina.1